MTIKMPRNLMTAISVVAFAVMLHGCGGGGGSSPVATMDDDTPPTTPPTTIMGQIIPSGTTLTLPPGHGLQEGTLRAKMGETVTLRDDDGNVIVSGTCTDVDCSADLTGDTVTLVGDVELVEANALVLALLTDLLPPDPADLNELETAQAAAAGAADAAMTAAGNANTTATEAETARATAATLQTGETSEGLAEKAREQAGLAHTAATEAETASEAAAAADNVSDAIRAQVDAENARDAAQAAETNAGNYAQMAADAADVELLIVDTVKSVGDKTIDAAAPRSVVTTGEGATEQVTDTGLQPEAMQPTTMGSATPGVAGVDGNPEADTDPYKAPVTSAAARTFGIGKLVDSADDTARLMIITRYAGTKTVNVYASTNGGELTGSLGSDGRIDTSPTNLEDDAFVTLKSEGMYYRAGTDATITVTPELDTDGDPQGSAVAGGDDPKAWAAPVEVFSYTPAGGTKTYVVLTTTSATGGVTSVIYSNVSIQVEHERDGDTDTTEMTEVTAKVPEASDYKHIHFGVWAGLGAAKPSGTQVPADLGIGFVQSIGDGLTGADMPNNGSGTYIGDWAATVQAADEDGDGKITLTKGRADLSANFGKDTITATLAGLATLKGDISGNTFSGEKASAIIAASGLDAEADFEGSFSGGFYGSKAAEAGGIFNFASDDGNNEGGAFRGAFGADRKLP